MRRTATFIAAICAAIIFIGAVAASPHAATRAARCGDTCDVGQHRGAMNDSMNMPGMGTASSDMTMGPHMKLSPKRAAQPGDAQRAAAVVTALRMTLAKYNDYHAAQAEGYKQFMPDVKQPRYHFTNWVNALSAERGFDAARPTSLIYEKAGDGYKLLGAMYTAPKNATPDQLDARIPLSIARWHEHVDICWGPPGIDKSRYFGPGAQFGLLGSINAKSACDSVGGRFQPVLFNWMVHVYPFETQPAKIWRVDMH